ncbi:MAG: 30S ribosomal protein S12 methylthiotransferase RimO, partial [Candidatus Aminicenantes bacterium]|nr:30S ribosomal protein S12 methylthiotransferase RimO [Candidatus Aminicenantes bacterium]
MNKIALISLGCAKNLVDSEVMMGHLRKSPYVFVPSPEEADIIIINTCGFIKPAKDETENAIQNALSIKHQNKKVRIIVTGCYVERYISVLRNNYPEVDVWLGVKDFDKIVRAVQDKPI